MQDSDDESDCASSSATTAVPLTADEIVDIKRGILFLGKNDRNIFNLFGWKQLNFTQTVNSKCKRQWKGPRHPSLTEMLRLRQLNPSKSNPLSKLSYSKRLYSINVLRPCFQQKVDFCKNTKTCNSTKFRRARLDKKSIYLGLSHDSCLLAQMSIQVADPLVLQSSVSAAIWNTVEGGVEEAPISLIVHCVSPLHLLPAFVVDLGRRSVFSVFYMGFPMNSSFLASVSFRNNDHKYFSESTVYNDTVGLDFVLFSHNLHVSMQAVVSFTYRKWHLCSRSFFRILSNGVLVDTGQEIVAIMFHEKEELLGKANNQNVRTVFEVMKKSSVVDAHSIACDEVNKEVKHAVHCRNITVQKCHSPSQTHNNDDLNKENSVPSLSYELQQVNISQTSVPSGTDKTELFISETFLAAEKVLQTVIHSLILNNKKKACKYANANFMGVTEGEAHVLDVKGQIATVLVIGVVEIQDTRYIFLRMSVELEWDMSQPAKMNLLHSSTKEIDWRLAIAGKQGKPASWQPRSIPVQFRTQDRLITNDVQESLKFMAGSCHGGIVFTL
uniref:Uncharacterized protein n=1 Tax=Ditylenchus dipsaci TaxID=166011 RepID=A0A915EU72_9BILA